MPTSAAAHKCAIFGAIILSTSLCFGSTALAGTIEGTLQHNKGNANIVVSVTVPTEHPSPRSSHPLLDQQDLAFVPHVLPVLVGTTVDFINNDPVNHNVFSPDGEGYNLGTWSRSQRRSHTFSTVGVYTQLCTLHPEMEGFVVVLATPHFAVTDAEGHFTISGVPDGHYSVAVWGPKLKRSELAKEFAVDVIDGHGTLAIAWTD
ncbi:MAG: hypothetical protein GXP62_19445 [Oligoflexia bacterium]|nr:hypothetical protein [Oligoflexia bacterium]